MGKVFEAFTKTGTQVGVALQPEKHHKGAETGAETVSSEPLIAESTVAGRDSYSRIREVALSMKRIDPHLAVLNEFDSSLIEQYSRVAISIIATAEERNIKKILIASAQHGEGRTSVTLNLAGAMSNANRRVLVIDADFLRPSILRLLSIENSGGFTDMVLGGKSFEESAIRVQPHGFTILPSPEGSEWSARVLGAARLRSMLDQISQNFDFVLFDSSPLLRSSDVEILGRLTDATLLVIGSGQTTSEQMQQALLQLSREKVIGSVVNRIVA